MQKNSNKLTSKLLDWYKKNARALPWRTDYQPYHVFISELMLQQTQMERGISYFKKWIERFPTLFDVANAKEDEILHAWEGLGYYRRARYLHETAKKICTDYSGIIPHNKEILQTFKGLGDYTIAAICGIAYNQDIVTIDANVERVFARLFMLEGDTKKNPTKAKIKDLAYNYLPNGKAREYNQSLMELGALICKKKPLCELCPLQSFCLSYKNDKQENFPSPKNKQKLIFENWIELIFISSDYKILLNQRDTSSHWGGLFQFYPLEIFSKDAKNCIEKTLKELTLEQYTAKLEEMCKINYSYTNHRNNMKFYKIYLNIDLAELEKHLAFTKAISKSQLSEHAFPSPYRKAINQFNI